MNHLDSAYFNTFTNKKVIFVSTKNKDYIRNTQEIKLLEEHAEEVFLVAFNTKNYALRILRVYMLLIHFLIWKKFDILFIGFAPQFLFPLFPFFKKNNYLVIDFFISFYDTLVDDRKKIKENSFIAKILYRIDQYVLRKADSIITDTQAHRTYFSDEFKVASDKMTVLYLEADTTIYKTIDYSQFETKEANSNVFTVVYFGSILPVQGLEVILNAMKQLINETNIHFIIIGPLSKKLSINTADYPNTRFIPWLDQNQLAQEIALADLALAGHFSDTVGKANRTIAGKTYIYKAMNKPIILGDSDANRELFVDDAKMNFYVPRGDSTALAEKIIEIRNNTKKGLKINNL